MSKMNPGDRIVCILNNRATLTVGKEYVVQKDEYYEDDYGREVLVHNDDGESVWYAADRFITLQRFRELRITQLQSNEKDTEDDNN